MVELNHRNRTIRVKIVYYGPPIGGKTTNLQVLHKCAQATRRGEMISINSAQDRTILFDLLPLKAAGFRGFDLRLQILAVPGQAMYAATRRMVLKGADALVFVANSAADRWEENLQSFREMTQNLIAHQLDPASMPLVFQYNKRDLPQVTPLEFMDRTLNTRGVGSVPAVAIRGEGVLETFSAILMRTMQDLAQRYQLIEIGKTQTMQQWTQGTIQGVFGTGSIAFEPNAVGIIPEPAMVRETVGVPEPAAAAHGPARRTVRVALPEEAMRAAWAGPDARSNETLVESYAQASSQLGAALEDVREERDTAQHRLEDVQYVLAAAQEVLSGQPLDAVLRSVLARMADAAGAAHASFLRPEGDRSVRVAALRGLAADPMVQVPAGLRHVVEKLLTEVEPRVHQAADSLDLGDALEAAPTPFTALVAAPARTQRRLHGLAMFYYPAELPAPRPDTLAHLGVLARALAVALELGTASESTRTAERVLHPALVGTASIRGMEEVLTAVLDLRERLSAMRTRSDTPPWFADEFVNLTPSLAAALGTGRSLLAFSRGEILREVVDVEDLVADLRAEGATVAVGPGAGVVLGDPLLLRLALLALRDHARDGGASDSPVEVRVFLESGRVALSVGHQTRLAPDLTLPPRGSAPSGRDDLRMALVYRIVELHGGTFSTSRDSSMRTWFTLTLPPA